MKAKMVLMFSSLYLFMVDQPRRVGLSDAQVDGTEDGIEMSFGNNGVSCKLSKRLPDYVKTCLLYTSDAADE